MEQKDPGKRAEPEGDPPPKIKEPIDPEQPEQREDAEGPRKTGRTSRATRLRRIITTGRAKKSKPEQQQIEEPNNQTRQT